MDRHADRLVCKIPLHVGRLVRDRIQVKESLVATMGVIMNNCDKRINSNECDG